MVKKNDNQGQDKMTRAQFLKKAGLLTAGVAVAAKLGNITALAAPSETSNGDDREVGAVPPYNKSKVWVDTTAGGVTKYWNGTEWVPTKATWG